MTERQRSDLRVDGDYYHGFDLHNEMACHNLLLGGNGFIRSIEFTGRVDPGVALTHVAIDEVPIEVLELGFPEGNIVSPRMVRLVGPGAALKRGLTLVDGFGDPWRGSSARAKEWHTIEVEFERGRRLYAPDAPSRLTALWMVPRTSEGEAAIRRMLPKAYILRVKVQCCLRIATVDAAWLDCYLNFPKPEYIRNYWAGLCHPTEPCPEIMIDGVLQAEDPEQLAYINRFGARLCQGRPPVGGWPECDQKGVEDLTTSTGPGPK